MRTSRLLVLAPIVLLALPSAGSTYLTPPQVMVDVLDARPAPQIVVSPTRNLVALLERPSMPSIADMAQPMLKLAGTRIDPALNGIHRSHSLDRIVLKRVPEGTETVVKTPPGAKMAYVRFSPDGTKLSFTRATDSGMELWVADTSTGAARALTRPELNGAAGDPCEWEPGSTSILCAFVPANRGAPPPAPKVPDGPTIQETAGKPAPVRTYQDLLENAYDEALFDYYGTSQLASVQTSTGVRTDVGKPGIFLETLISPDGAYVLVSRAKRPYSYLVPADDFPKEVEIWNRRGEFVKKIADLPLADTVPMNGVPTGPRNYEWRTNEPATLIWVEALDEGNPKNKVPHRDKVLTLKAPFSEAPSELARTEFRFSDLAWTDKGTGFLEEYDRTTRKTRAWILEGSAPRLLWDRSAEDRYGNPGRPLRRPTGVAPGFFDGSYAPILQFGNSIYLTGAGASPQGDRPFLDRLDLETLTTVRLHRTDDKSYETVVTLLSDDAAEILTRYETRVDPPNLGVRGVRNASWRPITSYPDPAPALKGLTKELITYKRADGVGLSATLYLPPGHKPGERHPLLMWAYPREFTDASAAGQVSGSANRFTTVGGPSHLLFLTQGYAILDDPAMPIVGKEETANDTYVEQLVANAQAAVDKVVEMGVADRSRVAIGGHSYGAFMTANLLAHSDLFRAGIARSGAYNRTLTPFGFQNEQRSFWEVPDTYARMSPFWFAHKIKEPILLIHGEADNNSGTFPIQSERFFMALKGHGATVRYVTLPHEAHGYMGRESVLHTVAEMLNWCDRWVKNPAPTPTSNGSGR